MKKVARCGRIPVGPFSVSLEGFTTAITVQVSRIVIEANGHTTVDYTEPGNVVRPPERKGRKLNPLGDALALQAHHPTSVFSFQRARVRALESPG